MDADGEHKPIDETILGEQLERLADGRPAAAEQFSERPLGQDDALRNPALRNVGF